MDTKPGYKTTEFWLSLLATLLGFLLASGVMDVARGELDRQADRRPGGRFGHAGLQRQPGEGEIGGRKWRGWLRHFGRSSRSC